MTLIYIRQKIWISNKIIFIFMIVDQNIEDQNIEDQNIYFY